MDSSPTDLLGPAGPLAARIPGFAPRVQQQIMAEAVTDALAETATLIVEAGTGTGKTFAYLLPALLSGQKVIVSTGTKTLQDQLFHRDLPTLRSALGVATRIAQPTRGGVHANYDVAPNGRFLIVENIDAAETRSSVRVIVNWQSLLPQAR